MTVCLYICLRDQYCAPNFGHIIVIICTNTAEKGHTHLRFDFYLTMLDLLGKACSARALLAFILSVGHLK